MGRNTLYIKHSNCNVHRFFYRDHKFLFIVTYYFFKIFLVIWWASNYKPHLFLTDFKKEKRSLCSSTLYIFYMHVLYTCSGITFLCFYSDFDKSFLCEMASALGGIFFFFHFFLTYNGKFVSLPVCYFMYKFRKKTPRLSRNCSMF